MAFRRLYGGINLCENAGKTTVRQNAAFLFLALPDGVKRREYIKRSKTTMTNLDKLSEQDTQEIIFEPVTAEDGKLFTQEEVNTIISDRLKRQKEALTADITARENKMKCYEWLKEWDYDMGLLEALDTSDFDVFRQTVINLRKLDWQPKTPAPPAEQTKPDNLFREVFSFGRGK